MPLKKVVPLKKLLTPGAMLLAIPTSGVFGTATASAGLLPTGLFGLAPSGACTTPGGSAVFSKFGDNNAYIPAPNATFTNSATGWTIDRQRQSRP